MKIQKLCLIYASFLLFIGCEELDRYPQTTVSEATFWSTRDEAVQAVNGIYNVLTDGMMYDGHFTHLEGLSNNAVSVLYHSPYRYISENVGWDTSNGASFGFWSKAYEGIVRANQVIVNVADMQINTQLKNRLLGEAHFLRALFYFHLTNHFGDVPLILEIQTVGEESYVSRDPVEEVVNQVKSDLDFAIQNLPVSYPSEELGRVTRGAAYALKSRVHLYHEEWAEVISAVDNVTQLGYGLLPMEQWPVQFLPEGNNNDTESIFEVQFKGFTGFGLGNSALQNFGIISFVPAQFGTDVFPTTNLAESFEEGDPRRDWTILFPGEEFGGVIFTGLDMQDPNWALNGLDREKAVIPQPNIANDGDQNFVVIRYAEMLLNLAEAENELNGPSGAYDPINRIRNRVGLPDLPEGLTQEEMRNAIKHERRVELAFEGQYYFDLLRWGPEDMKAAMESVVEPGHTRTFSPRVMLWPIPQREIDVNPNLTQNPLW